MKMAPRTSSAKDGRIWFRLCALVAALGIAIIALLYFLVQIRLTAQCEANLLAIYRALELYEMERGSLPNLAYYPDMPMEDADSLRIVLEPYGLSPECCVCPQSKPILRAAGLTYIWNVQLNGKRIPRGTNAVWMLVNIEALTDDVPAPHFGRYNVLYSDGVVRRVRDPMRELPGL
jgi:hypothetical protein